MANGEEKEKEMDEGKEITVVQLSPNKLVITGYVNGDVVDVKKLKININNKLCLN